MTERRSSSRVTAPSPRRIARLRLVAGFIVCMSASACLPSGARESIDLPASPSLTAGPTPTAAPTGPTPRPSFVRPTPTPQPTSLVYTVGRGDSLNSIAHRFGTTARSIAFWNRAVYPSLDPESRSYKPGLLEVGWTLMIIPNGVFDEQDLPEPSDLIGPEPTASSSDDSDAVGSGTTGGEINPNAP